MAYLLHKESHFSVTSSLNLFNTENVDLSVKHGYYEQFYSQLLSENEDFQTYSSEEDFIDLTSTIIDLQVIVKTSQNEKPSPAEELSHEYCVLNNLFKQKCLYK